MYIDEDIGTGQMENSKSKSAAYDKAYKQAVTDATKRALKVSAKSLTTAHE